MRIVRSTVFAFAIAVAALAPAGVAHAGQPNVSCGEGQATAIPGQSDSAPGSPFGDGTSDSHYAGEDDTASLAHAHSANAVSQYDVACLHGTR
jgi:hypothetical protein